jgi:hypothetical protein
MDVRPLGRRRPLPGADRPARRRRGARRSLFRGHSGTLAHPGVALKAIRRAAPSSVIPHAGAGEPLVVEDHGTRRGA